MRFNFASGNHPEIMARKLRRFLAADVTLSRRQSLRIVSKFRAPRPGIRAPEAIESPGAERFLASEGVALAANQNGDSNVPMEAVAKPCSGEGMPALHERLMTSLRLGPATRLG